MNNGVLGFDLVRDRELLDAWLFAVDWAIGHPELRHLIRWYDQGALLWAVVRTNNDKRISSSNRWNYPARPYLPLLSQAIKCELDFVEVMRRNHPGAGIIHWFGLCKLSIALDDEVNKLFSRTPK